MRKQKTILFAFYGYFLQINHNADAISETDINKIIEAGVNAPTGDNFKTTRFIVVREKDMLLKIANSRTAGTGPTVKILSGRKM